MDLQEMFNQFLRYQSDSPGKAVNERGNCVYKNEHGQHCAIGCLKGFPEDCYKVIGDVEYLIGKHSWFETLDFQGAMSLQVLHDQGLWEDDKLFWSSIEEFAGSHDLTIPNGLNKESFYHGEV